MKTALKIVLPFLVATVGAAGAFILIKTRAPVEVQRPTAPVPLVRAAIVFKRDLSLVVRSEGTVRPVTQSTLVPEVSGRIVSVASTWADGGFFRAGEVLVEVDATDYRFLLEEAEARVADAELALAREEEEARIAKDEWEELGGEEAAPPLVQREPQLIRARASVEAAGAALSRAKLDLDRTRVVAPYAGRIRRKSVDIGQYVTRGAAIAEIYSVEKAEVRLPIADRELAYVELPLRYRDDDGDGTSRPPVLLRAEFAGREFTWSGTVVRTEGEIDPRSRRVHAVAEVVDPYGRGTDTGRPPLAVGMFVHAEVSGRTVTDVVVLPRHVLRGIGTVLMIDEDSRLRFRDVEVLRTQGDEVVIGAGLDDGERVCLSPLDVVVEGMEVEVEGEDERIGSGEPSGESLTPEEDS